MLIHISSGNGVDEVCRALWHFMHYIENKYNFKVVNLEYAKCKDAYKSILIDSEDKELLALQGTHLWHCQSPFRTKHKRKNWYFSLYTVEEEKSSTIDVNQVVYQTMKSPKNGGQHVNTTCSGVRAIYPPLGLEVLSYDERSQHRNKSIALARLLGKAQALKIEKKLTQQKQRWKKGKQLERGNTVRVYKGENFKELIR